MKKFFVELWFGLLIALGIRKAKKEFLKDVPVVSNSLFKIEFGEWSKQSKKHAIVHLEDGRKMKAYQYLKLLADKMPLMFDSVDGRRIDHLENLKLWYYHKNGIEGIREYVNMVDGTLLDRAAAIDKNLKKNGKRKKYSK